MSKIPRLFGNENVPPPPTSLEKVDPKIVDASHAEIAQLKLDKSQLGNSR